MKLIGINKLTDCKFLNLYKLKLINKVGNNIDYFVASRRTEEDLSCKRGNHDYVDGVMIIPITADDKFVLIKQFRPAINDYIYEFPAGLVDQGESIEESAKRELFEETGLTCVSYEYIIKPSYTSVGMSDETVAVVKMIVEGEPTNKNLEESEEIEVVTIPIKDAKSFIKNNNVALKTALVISFLE